MKASSWTPEYSTRMIVSSVARYFAALIRLVFLDSSSERDVIDVTSSDPTMPRWSSPPSSIATCAVNR